jgi:hypothetical protein
MLPGAGFAEMTFKGFCNRLDHLLSWGEYST